MELRVKDFLDFDYFSSLEVIAGAEGLSRPADSCAFLDYELDKNLNQKYANRNFRPGQMVITSLMFAKDDPFLIRDAVKYVISKGCSALIIKNVYRLPIHDYILRYADSKQFPILMMTDLQMHFDGFTIQVNKCVETARSAEAAERELGRLLYQPLELTEKKNSIRTLFPRFYNQYAVLYCHAGRGIDAGSAQQLHQRVTEEARPGESVRVLRYRDGLFLFLSADLLEPAVSERYSPMLAEQFPGGAVGVSAAHIHPEETDAALREAMYAARVHHLNSRVKAGREQPWCTYGQMGVYRALLPMLDSEELQRYSGDLLDPILEFDAENRGNLLDTLLEFVQCGGNLHELSARSGQHENTLRNRLDRIGSLTGLSYRKLDDYEQLALAARVYLLLNH